MTPELHTSRLLLVPYYAHMVTAQHVGWLNDPEIVRYSEQRHQHHTEETQHLYLNLYNHTSERIWLIKTKANGASVDIGTITAMSSIPNKRCDMGILIGEREAWGKSYGKESWQRVMDYLWEIGMNKIEGGCMQGNIRMLRVFNAVNMYFEATRIGHFLLDGNATDLIMYGIRRSDT